MQVEVVCITERRRKKTLSNIKLGPELVTNFTKVELILYVVTFPSLNLKKKREKDGKT